MSGVGGEVGEEDRARRYQAYPRDRQRDHRQQRPRPDPAAGAQPRHRRELGCHGDHAKTAATANAARHVVSVPISDAAGKLATVAMKIPS